MFEGWAKVIGLVLVLFMPAALAADSDGGEPSMRDPLRPPSYGATATEAGADDEVRFDASAWRLYSTLVSSERRTAVINGRNVREGGRVGGATVIAIESNAVTLDYRGRRFTIRDSSPSVRSNERHVDRSP